MGKIIRLDSQLSNKIAAGEVVERPASVVKELLENAIDANGTIIEIEVEEAGLSKIRIIDNGDGIEAEDCLNAFHRHATSKIKDENDLFRIRTLGFRGEALPSIASVSRLVMKTSTGHDAGTKIILSGGKVELHESTTSRKGTDITVTDLFYNTPARLKYMKTIHTELGNISDIVDRIALAHPEVSIRLVHNGKKLLHTNGQGDVRHVLAGIYGTTLAKSMLPISFQSLDFEVKGYVSLPEVTRASRSYISTIINGRFIRNYSLAKAIQQGYHTLLPIGRYPIVLLDVTMDPLLVDVNVHPSKLEVRLSKEVELNELVSKGLKELFRKQQLIPSSYVQKEKISQHDIQQHFTFEHATKRDQPVEEEQKPIFIKESSSFLLSTTETAENESERLLPYGYQETNELKQVPEEKDVTPLQVIESSSPLSTTIKERIPPLYPIGQMHGTYILAQNENGLYILDQHAAQERIKYEFFKEKVAENHSEVQELLVPLTFEYATSESLIIEAHLEQLSEVGIFLEDFGRNCYIVRSHPQWFPQGDETEIIVDIIQQVLDEKKIDIKKLREEAAIMMSCKASIKANHHLRIDEMFALLETLRKTTDPFTCPHGRPILVHYSTYEMEKMFKRVM